MEYVHECVYMEFENQIASELNCPDIPEPLLLKQQQFFMRPDSSIDEDIEQLRNAKPGISRGDVVAGHVVHFESNTWWESDINHERLAICDLIQKYIKPPPSNHQDVRYAIIRTSAVSKIYFGCIH
eukprot:910405_1